VAGNRIVLLQKSKERWAFFRTELRLACMKAKLVSFFWTFVLIVMVKSNRPSLSIKGFKNNKHRYKFIVLKLQDNWSYCEQGSLLIESPVAKQA